MGDSNVDGDGSEVNGDGDGDDGDGSGGTSLSRQGAGTETSVPRISSVAGRSCGTASRKLLINLGFSRQRELIGGRAVSEVDQGAHTTPWHGQEGGCVPPPGVVGPWPPPALLRSLS
jgi:hypothetical protein